MCVVKNLWPCGSMAYVVTQLWLKYYNVSTTKICLSRDQNEGLAEFLFYPQFLLLTKKSTKIGFLMSRNVEKFEIHGLNSILSLFNDVLPLKNLIIYYTMFQVLNHFQTFLKSFPDFCWFLTETSKEKDVGVWHGMAWHGMDLQN